MIDQIGIAVTGTVAVFLTQSTRPERRRYACLFGIVGQPFWFYSTYHAQQWGTLFICLIYATAWLKGLWTHWLIPWYKGRQTQG